jgi:hypothetical protein
MPSMAACRVAGAALGVDRGHDKAGRGAEHGPAGPTQLVEEPVEGPDLAAGAAAEGGRVQHDTVVAYAAALLAAQVGQRILDNPADGAVLQARQRLVLARPGHRLPGRIDVGDVGAGLGCGQGGQAGVAEEVEHAQGMAGRARLAGDPVPVDGVLWKDAHLARLAGLNGEAQRIVAHFPLGRYGTALLPAALLHAGRLEDCAGGVPVGTRQGRRPRSLRLRPDQRHRPEALQLAAVAAVQQLVVLPGGGGKGGHGRS